MTSFNNTLAIAAAALAIAGTALFPGQAAYARGGKGVFVQDYQFAKPMHGYSGYSNAYYCDYQRLPNRKCVITANGTESCRVVGWTLREMCQ